MDETEIKIELGVPMPQQAYRGAKRSAARNAIESMSMGASFFLPNKKGSSSEATRNSLNQFMSRVRKESPERRFATRLVTENGVEGVRIWRVE